jgi:GNAT superfamily N-acetyltransferase
MSTFTPGDAAVVITRVAERHWHALEDDRVVGRGESTRRPDGRIFLSIDAWHGAVFDQLAATMLPDLPRPLYTVVDEADVDLTFHWERAGFTTRRREWEYVVPTGVTRPALPGVTIEPAREAPLRELDRAIRTEVEATVGWPEMPAEVVTRPVPDPAKCTVATEAGRYVGMVRVVPLRQPRIGLIAVRAEWQRRGIGRALLAHVLGALHSRGFASASAEVTEANSAAIALFEGFGARRAGSNLELVVR